MSRLRSLPAVAVVTALALVGCSGEDAAESILENAIERESGGDVDIDLGDLAEGGFSIETDEGSMTVDEDGNFVITDENGEVITGDVNLDGNGIDVSTDDGSFSMETDSDGSIVLETDDGTVISGGATTDLPDGWPAAAPEPTGITIQSSAEFSDDTTTSVSVSGVVADGAAWAEAYGEQLVDAGFTEQSVLTNPDSVFAGYELGDLAINLSVFDNGDGTWLASVSALSTSS